jgi:hypothetical protein
MAETSVAKEAQSVGSVKSEIKQRHSAAGRTSLTILTHAVMISTSSSVLH